MKVKNTIVNRLKWSMDEEERSMHFFYMMEEMRENLNMIERLINTDCERDFHRMANLEIMSEQLSLMADHLYSKTKNTANA